jgi:hypothetical protein
MGYIASRHPDARFVVVSNDKGYAPMLEHAGEFGFAARQAAFGASKPSTGRRPMFSLASTSTPAEKTTPPVAKKAASKTSTDTKEAGAVKPKAAAQAATRAFPKSCR